MSTLDSLSIPSPTNVIRTPPPPTITFAYQTPTTYPKQHQSDLNTNKPSSSSTSSTLVHLLKQTRSPPSQTTTSSMSTTNKPVTSNIVNNAQQSKTGTIVKQSRKPTKKSQTQPKRLSVNHEIPLQVFYLDTIFES